MIFEKYIKNGVVVTPHPNKVELFVKNGFVKQSEVKKPKKEVFKNGD